MALGAEILKMIPLFMSNEATIEFSKPVDNGIRIMSPDYLISPKSKYYGDEINLGFWKLLNLPFGSTPSPSNPYTLQSGYKYIYNHERRIFDIYDDNDTNIFHKENIATIVDLNIDFTIHKSHQFEIIYEGAGRSHFIFPARLLKELLEGIKQDCINSGIDNMYKPDRVRPYSPSDIDNPEWDFPHYLAWLGEYETGNTTISPTPIHVPDNYDGIVKALNYFKDIDFSKNSPTSYFYLKRYSPEVFVKLLQKFDFKMLTGDFLLPWLATNMYPDLMPVQRMGETQTNRPVYEPWMIWGFLLFIFKIRRDDIDDLGLPVFDLAPKWT